MISFLTITTSNKENRLCYGLSDAWDNVKYVTSDTWQHYVRDPLIEKQNPVQAGIGTIGGGIRLLIVQGPSAILAGILGKRMKPPQGSNIAHEFDNFVEDVGNIKPIQAAADAYQLVTDALPMDIIEGATGVDRGRVSVGNEIRATLEAHKPIHHADHNFALRA